MRKWIVGDSIDIPGYGTATISFAGQGNVGLTWTDGRDALFRVDHLEALLAGGKAAAVNAGAEPGAGRPWPADTFVADDAPERHAPGSHWQPFAERAEDIVSQVSSWLPQMEPFMAYGSFFAPPDPLPPGWPQGFALCWPDVHAGVVVVCRSDEAGNEVVSLYPYYERGVQTRLRLDRVYVQEDGLEGQIEATWHEVPITFFDPAFVINRGWYRRDREYDFILLGIAYAARPAEVDSMSIRTSPDQQAWGAVLAARDGREAPEAPSVLTLSGMAMLLPIEEWDRDDYHFRGPIKEVADAGEMLGEAAWRVVVTVMRVDDEAIDLPVLVTRRAWAGAGAPQLGMDMEGSLWLQGRLWQPARGNGGGARQAAAPPPVPAEPEADDDDAPTLPAAQQRHFAALADALREVMAELDKPSEAATRDWGPGAFHERAQALLAHEVAAIEQLVAAVNGPLARVGADTSTPAAALNRMAGRMLEAASQLQRLQREARAVPATGDQIAVRAQLAAAFARPVHEFRAWLDEVVEALDDPIAAARKRGLEGPEINLPLHLTLTEAPEATRLAAWFDRQTRRVADDCDDCDEWDDWDECDDCDSEADAALDRRRWWCWVGLGALAAWLTG